MRKLFGVSLGVLVALLTIVLASEGISAGDAMVLVSDADLTVLGLFLLTSLSMAALRAFRLRQLLPDSSNEVSFSTFLSVIFLRNVCADLLPAKMGSAVIIPLAVTKLGVSSAHASAAWGLEYLLDIIALLPLVAFLTIPLADLIGVSWWVPIAVAGAGLAATATLFVWAERYLSSLRGILDRFSHILAEAFAQALVLSRAGSLVKLLALSVAIRAMKYLALYLLAAAMLAPLGFGFEALPLGAVTLATFSSEITATLPGLSFAGVGAPQGVWGVVISQLGAPLSLAIVVGLAAHLLSQAYALALGALALTYLYAPGVFARSSPRVAVAGSLLAALFLAGYTIVEGGGSEAPYHSATNKSGESLATSAPPTTLSLPTVVADARIGDSFGLIKLDPQGGAQVLLDTPLHESEPALAPDGSFIAYAQSRSMHRMAPRELWLLDLSTGRSRRLIGEARYPQVSADGKRIYFERNRSSFWELTLEGGEAREIFRPSGDLAGHAVVTPRISPDGSHIAFVSDAPERWWVTVVNRQSGKVTKVAHGCQPRWRDSTSLLFIKNRGARGGAGIGEYSLEGGTVRSEGGTAQSEGGTVRMVVDTELSEYFVSPTPDGGVLYADASPGDADHELGSFTARYRGSSGSLVTFATPFRSIRWPVAVSKARLGITGPEG